MLSSFIIFCSLILFGFSNCLVSYKLLSKIPSNRQGNVLFNLYTEQPILLSFYYVHDHITTVARQTTSEKIYLKTFCLFFDLKDRSVK